MKTQTIQFVACTPTLWTGRYARIPGDTAVYHLIRRHGKWWPVIYWDTDEDRVTCAALDCRQAMSWERRLRGQNGLCRAHKVAAF